MRSDFSLNNNQNDPGFEKGLSQLSNYLDSKESTSNASTLSLLYYDGLYRSTRRPPELASKTLYDYTTQ